MTSAHGGCCCWPGWRRFNVSGRAKVTAWPRGCKRAARQGCARVGMEWSPPPTLTLHKPSLPRLQWPEVTSLPVIPCQEPQRVECPRVYGHRKRRSFVFQGIFFTFNCFLLVLRTFDHDHVHVNSADGGLGEALSFLQQVWDVSGGNPIVWLPSKGHQLPNGDS